MTTVWSEGKSQVVSLLYVRLMFGLAAVTLAIALVTFGLSAAGSWPVGWSDALALSASVWVFCLAGLLWLQRNALAAANRDVESLRERVAQLEARVAALGAD
ncbi:MAG: hypothetical protein FJX74_03835 [Armatimonadetes bacterium]|nr:hypothetical protein [Armatimonadota bacterium]